MIFTLTYVSTLAESVTGAELEELLEGSRMRNSHADITGLLLYRQGRVMQILEGEESAVRELFQRIASDVRHHDVVQVWSSTARDRRFADWTMGFEMLADPEGAGSDGSDGSAESFAAHDAGARLLELAARGPGEDVFVPTWTVERLEYDQRAFLDRRTGVLRRALADPDRAVSALAAILYAHEPAAELTENGVVLLHCTQCRPEEDGHSHGYPCFTARSCLQALEPAAQAEVA